MDTETRTALRDTYLYVFDAFAVGSPTEIVDAEIANNPRHARELLGILVNANLLVIQNVNGEEDVWQAAKTYDDVTREDAEGTIDNWLVLDEPTQPASPAAPTKEKKMPTKTTAPAKPIEFKSCLCGCGENVPPKSNFRPGHDARMAGQVARAMAADGEIDERLQTLPTEALRDKAMGIYDKAVAKANAKTAKADAKIEKVEIKSTPDAKETTAKVTVSKPKPTPRKRAARKTTAKA